MISDWLISTFIQLFVIFSEFVESSDESGNEKDENEIDQFPNDNEVCIPVFI